MVSQSIIPLLNDQTVRRRLAGMLTESQIQTLVLSVHPAKKNALVTLRDLRASILRRITEEQLSISSHELIILWRSALLATLVAPASEFEKLFADQLKVLLHTTPFHDVLSHLTTIENIRNFGADTGSQTSSEDMMEEQTNGVPTKCAGLVLVAHHVPSFFHHLDLIKDNRIVDEARAVSLLHYIAGGNTAVTESDVVLEKVLCGVRPETGVENAYSVSDEEKNEVNELLLTVITQWATLKTTSPQGLQEAFLMRDGLLIEQNGEWHLHVERQPVDLMLDAIPWNFRMFTLPWMSQILHVHWD